MSNMYAIKDTTLTALGDAVRNKTGRIVEEINNFFINNSSYPTITSNSSASKYRFIINSNEDINSSEGLRVYEGSVSGQQLFSNYLEDGVLPLTIETTNPTLVFIMFASSGRTFNITIIPLDENGNEYKYTPLEMADAINGLKIIPSSATTIAGDCQYKFSANGWNWFIDEIGDEIKTNDVSSCYYMFYNANTLTHIPFDINITKGLLTVSHCFDGCKTLEEVPYIIGPADKALPTSAYSGCITLDHLFQYCEFLRYIPDDYFWKIIPNEAYWVKWRELSNQACNGLFQNCYSLRKLPDISMLGANEGYYSALYSSLCYQCFSLDEIIDLPVSNASFSSNAFGDIVRYCYRLKDFIFATNEDGTAKTAKWKGQTIDLSGAGFGYHSKVHIFNSGITADKEVKDDATYQALKNDPDWFANDVNYSRYNHTSAVNTINSLPDCSATGTNTIKFMGASGALTDGGAINTLTEEEIAVATAKGWTVSFV